MNFFRQLFGKPVQRPLWAAHLSAEEFLQFKKQFSTEAMRCKSCIHIDWEEGRFLRQDQVSYPLSNIINQYAQAGPSEKFSVIQAFFRMLDTERDYEEMSYNDLREQVRIRLADPLRVVSGTISRPLNDQLCATVAVDRPTMVTSLSQAEATKVGFTDKQLFEYALNQTLSKTSVDVTQQDITKGLKVTVVEGDSQFVSTHALKLNQFNLVGDAQWIIIPTRNIFAFVSANQNLEKFQLEALLQIAQNEFKQSSQPVCEHLMMFTQNRFELMSYAKGRELSLSHRAVRQLVA